MAFVVLAACRHADPDCTLEPDGSFGPKSSDLVFYEEIVAGLEVPWALAFLPDGDLLVTERPGRIRRFHDGVLQAEPLATLEVDDSAGGGLLGLAVDPRFDETHAIYVFDTHAASDGQTRNRVERFLVDADQEVALRDAVVIDDIPTGEGHDGGRLWFDEDGLLYVGTGDAGDPDLAQDPDSLAGKILRVATATTPLVVETYALGLRNPVGIDGFGDGRVLVADQGPDGDVKQWSGYDELNIVDDGDDLGWPDVHACTAHDEDVAPLLTWAQPLGPGALHRLSGGAIDALEGDVFVTALEGQHLQRIRLAGGEVGTTPTIERHDVLAEGAPPDGFGRLRDVVQGPDGYLYMTTSNCDGEGDCPGTGDKIIRIRP